MDAVKDGRLSRQKEAVALYMGAYWSRGRKLSKHRREIVRRTRRLARVAYGIEVQAFIAATSDALADDELSLLIDRTPAGGMLPTASAWTEPTLEFVRRPILWGLEEEKDEGEIAGPITRRRAVERIGRNEPCPCGSGKKYKRCCATKDRERLQDSSDVAGVTRAELRQHLEEHLTLERVHSLRAYELARLDARQIDPEFRPIILNRLTEFEEFDALRDFFDAIGVDNARVLFLDAIDAALRAGKLDKAESPRGPDADSRRGLARVPDAFAQGRHRAVEGARSSRSRSKGIDRSRFHRYRLRSARQFMAARRHSRSRGVAPLANPWDRDTLLEKLGQARDQVDLPALEPTEGMQDLWG